MPKQSGPDRRQQMDERNKGNGYGNRLDVNSRNAARYESSNPLAAAVQNMVEPGARAGGMVFDPYEAVATGAGAGAGRQMVGPGAGVGSMAGRTLAGLDAQRAVADANALAGWYEAMAYPGPPGPGGGTYDGYVQAYDIDPMLANDPLIELKGIGPLASPYGRQMVRGMAPSPDYINAQRVLGVNRVMGY